MMDEGTTWLKNCSNYTDSSYFDDYRCRNIYYARAISASLSIIMCCLVVFIIVLYKKYNRFTQRLVLYLVVPTLVISAVALDPTISDDNPSCAVAGFFMNWGLLAQRFIILCIVLHLLVFSFHKSKPWYLEILFHGIIWGFSLCLSIIPLFNKQYGSAGVWCWIRGRNHYELYVLRIICLYFWVWLCIFIEIVCFAWVVIRVFKQIRLFENSCDPAASELKRKYLEYIYPLMLYPLANFFLAIPVSINRIQNMIDPGNPNYILFLIHSIVYPIWGFFNMIMYFMNKETLQQLSPCAIVKRIATFSSDPLSNNYQEGVQHPRDLMPASTGVQTSHDME